LFKGEFRFFWGIFFDQYTVNTFEFWNCFTIFKLQNVISFFFIKFEPILRLLSLLKHDAARSISVTGVQDIFHLGHLKYKNLIVFNFIYIVIVGFCQELAKKINNRENDGKNKIYNRLVFFFIFHKGIKGYFLNMQFKAEDDRSNRFIDIIHINREKAVSRKTLLKF